MVIVWGVFQLAVVKVRDVALKVSMEVPRSVVIPDIVTLAEGLEFKTMVNDAFKLPSSFTTSPDEGVTVKPGVAEPIKVPVTSEGCNAV